MTKYKQLVLTSACRSRVIIQEEIALHITIAEENFLFIVNYIKFPKKLTRPLAGLVGLEDYQYFLLQQVIFEDFSFPGSEVFKHHFEFFLAF